MESDLKEQTDLAQIHLSLIAGSKKILNDLQRVSRLCQEIVFGSFLFLGALAIVAYFAVLPKEGVLLSGIALSAIGAWFLVRERTGFGRRCCEDICSQNENIESLVKSDGTVDYDLPGRSVIDTTMSVVTESEEWMREISRELFLMLFWPALAVLILLMSVYSISSLQAQALSLGFIIYIIGMTSAVYIGTKLKFRSWQRRVAFFSSKAEEILQKI